MKAEKEQEAKANPAAKAEPEQTKGAPEKVAPAGQPSAEETKEESKGPQAGPKPASSSEPPKEQQPKALSEVRTDVVSSKISTYNGAETSKYNWS